ncbi:MAG: AzlC family ABC transporter permease [Spirochaetia bacterium]|nr:AzlC family ABC transporter permease [Spirochaetia bacterium]
MKLKAFKAAFPYTIPIFAGFWFLGLTYGIYMNVLGFSFVYPMMMSLVIFGGSLEFVAAQMLLSAFAPLQTLLVALLIQARHLFYGISMLDIYNNTGWKKYYLIYGMCDESFSINYTVQVPDGVDKGWFMFFVTLLNQLYWVTGSTIGGLLGSLITFNTQGLEFVMTALFVVIFLEQWLKEKQNYTALFGVLSAVVCRLIFGSSSFIIPTMVCILFLCTVFRKPIEHAGEKE